MDRHKFYLMSSATQPELTKHKEKQHPRAFPREPEGTSCLAFEVQVNSYCHGQPLWIDRASPPIYWVFKQDQESLGWGLLSLTPSFSHVSD